MSAAVARAVSDGIFRHQLEGFDRYPKGRDERFCEVFNDSIISVDHARAVILEFREKMPTLQEIIDTAYNLRGKFEVTLSDRERWEREYGPAKPFQVDFSAMNRPGREIDRLWQEVLAFLRTTRFDGRGDIQQIHIGRCWQIAKHLGYTMNGPQQREIDAYEYIYPKSRESLPVKRAPITQVDVKALAAGDSERWE